MTPEELGRLKVLVEDTETVRTFADLARQLEVCQASALYLVKRHRFYERFLSLRQKYRICE